MAGIACASLLGMKEAVPLGGDFQGAELTSGLPNLQDAEGRWDFHAYRPFSLVQRRIYL